MSKSKRKRAPGAGRPKGSTRKEATKVIRVPVSKLQAVKELIKVTVYFLVRVSSFKTKNFYEKHSYYNPTQRGILRAS